MTVNERRVLDACADALKPYGFTASRPGCLLRPNVADGVDGWLGLNTASYADASEWRVNPVVGIRHIGVERLMVKLDNRTAPYPVISSPLGYLLPDAKYRTWTFPTSQDLTNTAADLAAAVGTYGAPFIERNARWDALTAAAEQYLLNVNKPKVLAVIALLAGKRETAVTIVENELGRIADKSDAYAENYRRFAAALLRLES